MIHALLNHRLLVSFPKCSLRNFGGKSSAPACCAASGGQHVLYVHFVRVLAWVTVQWRRRSCRMGWALDGHVLYAVGARERRGRAGREDQDIAALSFLPSAITTEFALLFRARAPAPRHHRSRSGRLGSCGRSRGSVVCELCCRFG